GIYKMDLEPLYEYFEQPATNSEILYISPAILPEKDASGRKPDLLTYEKMAFYFKIPNAGQIKLSIIDENFETIFSDAISVRKGLNSYEWDLILGRTAIDDNPYAFRFVEFIEAGTYTFRLEGENIQLEHSFTVNEP
ncbi:MAG: hypothetical protein AAF705_21525, partial [Bacteroidota bacterium]